MTFILQGVSLPFPTSALNVRSRRDYKPEAGVAGRCPSSFQRRLAFYLRKQQRGTFNPNQTQESAQLKLILSWVR
jgi:hypothetical protein